MLERLPHMPKARAILLFVKLSYGSPPVTLGGMMLARQRKVTQALWDAIPTVKNLQCAWQLLLQSANPQANHTLRTLPPSCLAGTHNDNNDGFFLQQVPGDVEEKNFGYFPPQFEMPQIPRSTVPEWIDHKENVSWMEEKFRYPHHGFGIFFGTKLLSFHLSSISLWTRQLRAKRTLSSSPGCHGRHGGARSFSTSISPADPSFVDTEIIPAPWFSRAPPNHRRPFQTGAVRPPFQNDQPRVSHCHTT